MSTSKSPDSDKCVASRVTPGSLTKTRVSKENGESQASVRHSAEGGLPQGISPENYETTAGLITDIFQQEAGMEGNRGSIDPQVAQALLDRLGQLLGRNEIDQGSREYDLAMGQLLAIGSSAAFEHFFRIQPTQRELARELDEIRRVCLDAAERLDQSVMTDSARSYITGDLKQRSYRHERILEVFKGLHEIAGWTAYETYAPEGLDWSMRGGPPGGERHPKVLTRDFQFLAPPSRPGRKRKIGGIIAGDIANVWLHIKGAKASTGIDPETSQRTLNKGACFVRDTITLLTGEKPGNEAIKKWLQPG